MKHSSFKNKSFIVYKTKSITVVIKKHNISISTIQRRKYHFQSKGFMNEKGDGSNTLKTWKLHQSEAMNKNN